MDSWSVDGWWWKSDWYTLTLKTRPPTENKMIPDVNIIYSIHIFSFGSSATFDVGLMWAGLKNMKQAVWVGCFVNASTIAVKCLHQVSKGNQIVQMMNVPKTINKTTSKFQRPAPLPRSEVVTLNRGRSEWWITGHPIFSTHGPPHILNPLTTPYFQPTGHPIYQTTHLV